MGTSITTWENVTAYFTFADNPAALVLFTLTVSGIIVGLISSIMKHENKVFEDHK